MKLIIIHCNGSWKQCLHTVIAFGYMVFDEIDHYSVEWKLETVPTHSHGFGHHVVWWKWSLFTAMEAGIMHIVTFSPSGFRNPLPFLHNLTLLCCYDWTNQQPSLSTPLFKPSWLSSLGRSYTADLDTDRNGRMRMSWMSLANVVVWRLHSGRCYSPIYDVRCWHLLWPV